MISIRPYQPSDARRLLNLFRDTIRRVNAKDYDPNQISVWASDSIDPVAWAERFRERYAVVAELDEIPVGFTELEEDGHIDRFYVSANYQGKGIGQALIENILSEAKRRLLPRLYLEASITSRPFFERQGFTLIEGLTVTLRGVELLNYRMERVNR